MSVYDTIITEEYDKEREALRPVSKWYVLLFANTKKGEHTMVEVVNRPHDYLNTTIDKGQDKLYTLAAIVYCNEDKDVADRFAEAIKEKIRGSISKAANADDLARQLGLTVYGSFDPILKVAGADQMIERVPGSVVRRKNNRSRTHFN